MSDNTKLYYADLEVLLDTGYYNKIINEIDESDMLSSYQQIYKAKALRLVGRNKEAFEVLNTLDTSSDLFVTVQSLRERGHILLEMGYYETAQNMMNEAFEIFSIIRSDESEVQNTKADILHTSGNLLSYKGDFQNALNFWEESLKIKKSLGKVIDQAVLQNNIAIYYLVIEEYDQALNFFYEALRSIKPFEISKTITGILLNIGDTYFNSGNLEKALHFVHRSLDLTFNGSMEYIKSNCLLSLIKYYLISEDLNNVARYHNELLELATSNQSTYTHLMEKYAQAIILKSSSNKDDKHHAKSLFQQFLKPTVLDYQLFGNIVLNLADILIQEIYHTGNQKSLAELINIVEELYEDAQDKQLFHYVIDSLILKSKIVLINKEFYKAEFLLDQAVIIAEDNKFMALISKVKVAQLHLQMKINENVEAVQSNQSLQERIDLSGLLPYINSQLTHRIIE